MFLDNEMDAIDQILSDLDQWNILLYNSNSFSKKIFHYVRLLNEFTENNGHGALPPDFYSDKYNCMFDMMRINDSEIKKRYNPVKIRERKIERELKENGLLDSGATLFVNSESDNDEEHTFKNYKKNCKRVMSEHIRKIDIWKSEHPNIEHKGLLIYDETECYFEGYVKQMYEDQYAFLWSADKPLILHKPWMDASFIKEAYDSELDFIIWFFPYKPHSFLAEKEHYKYPDLVILDTRYPRTDFVQYNESVLERM